MNRTFVAFGLFGAVALCSQFAMALQTGVTGSSVPVDDMQPSLAINYLIRLQGEFANMGEIIPFAGSFVPTGWARCEGQLLSVQQNISLFSKVGPYYGGDGVSTFALPDLRGRTPVHRGQGPGLSAHSQGDEFGVESVVLNQAQMPAHDHTLPFGGNTSVTGGSDSFTNLQPSLAMDYVMPLQGNWPFPAVGVVQTPFLGQVRLFGGANLPAAHVATDGQLLAIAQNTDLFAVIGPTYGGDGASSFALPDVRGRTVVHEGTGFGLSPRSLGEELGSENVALTPGQLPAHDHTLPPSADVTGSSGGGAPFDNLQPSLVLNYIIAVDGEFPSPGADVGDTTFLGRLSLFAGTTAPRGWMFCDGQQLSIAQNTALFAILGVTFGGNGITTFALPDLRGRAVIGTGSGPGLSIRVPGEEPGSENTTLLVSQLPRHTHDYVPEPALLTLAALGGALGGLALRPMKR